MLKRYGLLTTAILVCSVACAADVQSLVKGIGDPSPDVRAEAFKTAGPLGAEAVAPLVEPLASQDGEVSKAAATALDNIADYACRPGAEGGKPAVAAELAKLLDPAKPPVVRTTAVRLLSLCGGDAEAPAVAALLADKDLTLADDARIALQNIPGDAADQALIAALPKANPAIAANIATALAQRKATAAIPALKDAVASGEPAVKWASLAALARLGVDPGEAMPRPDGGSEVDRSRWDDARLVVAANSEPAKALDLLKAAASQSEQDHQVATALLGLKKLDAAVAPDTFVPLAVAALKRPGARSTAVRLLGKDQAPQVDALLADSFAAADPATQSALVEVLASRKSEALGKVLEAAKQAEAPEVRLAAAEAAGEAPSVDLLFETVEKGSAWSRRHAADLTLTLATQAEATDAAAAQAFYERLVRSTADPKPKREAFAGFERLARVETLPLLDEFVAPLYDKAAPVSPAAEAFRKSTATNPELAIAAGRAYVTAHALQGKEQAAPVLLTVLESLPPYDLSSLAVTKLAELGVDPQALARGKGFLTNWQVLGPFPNEDGKAFEQAIVPEGDEALPESVGEVKRVDAQTQGLPAVLDLRATLHPNGPSVAYGYAEISSDSDKPATFYVGSDDGCTFWVNGKKLETVNGGRSLIPDNDKVQTTLRAGVNRVLIKVLDGGGDWAYCVRVTDAAGTPIDLNK